MNSRSLSLLGLVAAIVVIGLVALTADDDPGAVPRSVATEPLDRLTVAPIDRLIPPVSIRIAWDIDTSARGNQLWANFETPPTLNRPGNR